MKNLLVLMLKVLGIYVFILVILSLPELFGAIFLVVSDFEFTYFSFALFFFVVRLGISWALCMKSTSIADFLLKNEEVSEEKVTVSLPSVITIAVIIAGFWLVVNELPNLVIQLSNKVYRPQFNYESFHLFASLFKLGVGIWMIFCHKWITKRLERV